MKAENLKDRAEHNINQAATYNKAVNLLSTWLVHKKLENKEDDHNYFNDKAAINQNIDNEKNLKNESSNVIEIIDPQFSSRDDIFKENLRLQNRILLTFDQDQTALSQDFLHLLYEKHKQESRFALIILITIYLINTFLMIIIQKEIDSATFLLVFRACYIILLCLYLFYIMSKIKVSKWNLPFFLFNYFFGIFSCLLFNHFTTSRFLHQVGLIEMIFIYLIFMNSKF